MNTDDPTNERIELMVPAEFKAQIEKAAALCGQTISHFALAATLRQAEAMLQDTEVIYLSDRDRNCLLAALSDTKAKPGPVLKKAATRFETKLGERIEPSKLKSDMHNAYTECLMNAGFSSAVRFDGVNWDSIPSAPGVYVIFDRDECLYVGMAGRDGRGTLRKRLKDHSTGQVVNMFAQYLYLDRVQFQSAERIIHPRDAKAACRAYILENCSFRYLAVRTAAEARSLESRLKNELAPKLNGTGYE